MQRSSTSHPLCYLVSFLSCDISNFKLSWILEPTLTRTHKQLCTWKLHWNFNATWSQTQSSQFDFPAQLSYIQFTVPLLILIIKLFFISCITVETTTIMYQINAHPTQFIFIYIYYRYYLPRNRITTKRDTKTNVWSKENSSNSNSNNENDAKRCGTKTDGKRSISNQ